MKYSKIFFAFIIMLVVLVIASCNNRSNDNGLGKPTVAVSIVPQAAFAKAVCGDLVNIITIIPSGSSPENYEPTPREAAEFLTADIYFSIGVPAENAHILKNFSDSTKIVRLDTEVAKVYSELTIGSERDPHIWLSPKRAVVMVEKIAEEIGKIDPQNKAIYNANASEYIALLEAADARIQASVSEMQSKKFIVFHPAFGYLADDYDLTMYALESEGKEATPQRLAQMIELAKSENITAVFYQAESSSKQAKAFADNIGGKAIMLEPLSENYIENLEKIINLFKEVSDKK